MADPFLLQRGGQLYLFYETKDAGSGRGQIGVAASGDGGATFRHLAVVLSAPWHLSYPFVFEHEGEVRRGRGGKGRKGKGRRMEAVLDGGWVGWLRGAAAS